MRRARRGGRQATEASRWPSCRAMRAATASQNERSPAAMPGLARRAAAPRPRPPARATRAGRPRARGWCGRRRRVPRSCRPCRPFPRSPERMIALRRNERQVQGYRSVNAGNASAGPVAPGIVSGRASASGASLRRGDNQEEGAMTQRKTGQRLRSADPRALRRLRPRQDVASAAFLDHAAKYTVGGVTARGGARRPAARTMRWPQQVAPDDPGDRHRAGRLPLARGQRHGRRR